MAAVLQCRLLNEAVSFLLSVLKQPLTSDSDLTLDLPYIHAANILMAVFRESRVATQIRPQMAPAVMCAIEGFASSMWAIRNAATQLFGTISVLTFSLYRSYYVCAYVLCNMIGM